MNATSPYHYILHFGKTVIEISVKSTREPHDTELTSKIERRQSSLNRCVVDPTAFTHAWAGG